MGLKSAGTGTESALAVIHVELLNSFWPWGSHLISFNTSQAQAEK